MTKAKKQPKQKVLLAAVPNTYEGLQCWCPVDVQDENILRDRRVIEGFVSVDSRSLEQNALWAVWYSQIAKHMGQTVIEAKSFCKLHFGIPLLREQDAEFKLLYDGQIKKNITYEAKLKLMELIKVSSLLSKHNGKKYQSAIQQHFSENGLILEVL